MKMITHFSLGLMVASFFQRVVKLSTLGTPLMAIGGIAGLLPDFIDFKFWKFMEKYDYVVDPDPNNPDPSKMAETIAEAIDKAYETGKPLRLKLHTMQLGPDHWRQYQVEFLTEERKIRVKIGPVVNTGKIPYPETELPDEKAIGEAETKHEFVKLYPKPTVIDIFTGPSFKLKKVEDKIELHFIPFHREWSHSFTAGAVFGLIVALIWDLQLGLMFMLAFFSHVLSDQLGFLGCNLLPPITKERTPGFGLAESGNPVANFSTVYTAWMTILWNLNRFSDEPVIFMSPYLYFSLLVFLPVAVIIIGYKIYKWKFKPPEEPIEEKKMKELMEEKEEPFVEGD